MTRPDRRGDPFRGVRPAPVSDALEERVAGLLAAARRPAEAPAARPWRSLLAIAAAIAIVAVPGLLVLTGSRAPAPNAYRDAVLHRPRPVLAVSADRARAVVPSATTATTTSATTTSDSTPETPTTKR